MIDHFAAYDLL